MTHSPYTVLWSADAVETVKEDAARSPKSIRPSITKSLKEIDSRLRNDPMGFGEIYRSNGNVQEFLAVLAPVAVDFAVDIHRKIVQVRSSHVLAGPD